MTAQRVYDWERNFVEPRDIGFLSRDDTKGLVSAASSFLGIREPAVRFVKASSAPCKANYREWSIVISDWGRSRVTVLHEMAHLGSVQAVLRGEDGHGPTFVATAIALYERFLAMDPTVLAAQARAVGIQVGAMRAPPGARRFMDVEF